jgi:SPP1 family predicted phage head-tail adaptor
MEQLQAGDLRTKIRIQSKKKIGTGSFATEKWVDLGNSSDTDQPKYTRSKWYPLGGSETWIAQSVQAIDAANVVIRYNANVTSQCRVVKDGVVYSIIVPNDTDQHKRWLKFKVKAAVNGG